MYSLNIMTAVELLKEQLSDSYKILEGTMDDVTNTTANFKNFKKALSVGVAYAHAVTSEDLTINTILTNGKPIMSGKIKTGMSTPIPSFAQWDKFEKWSTSVKIDVTLLRAYAKKVHKATEKYLATLKDKDLNKKVTIEGWGSYTISHMLNNFIILHNASVAGEVSAAKGFQGKKGYPF